MIPNKNSHVKIFFKNNIQVEGYVESWSSNVCVLKSENNSLLVIQNLTDDVLMFIISETEKPKSEVIQSFEKEKNIIQEKFEETKTLKEPELQKIKKLAELKMLLNQQEKKIIQEKLKDHTISNVKETIYGKPRFLQVQGSEFDTGKKAKLPNR